MFNLTTEHESVIFTGYKDLKGNAKCRKWGVWDGCGSLKVIENSTIKYSAYEFLLAFCSRPPSTCFTK